MDISWRRFRTYLNGILSWESAFALAVHEDQESNDWRAALGHATGGDYSRPDRRVTLEEFTAMGN